MMGSPVQLAMRGHLVVIGKEPDGDSVRFIADTPDLYRQLSRAYRIRPSGDGSVQLRFEGVDAPELHYGADAQPLGGTVRDRLLERIGFTDVLFADRPPTRVSGCTPSAGVRAAILSTMAEANGRPVCYVLAGPDEDLPADGAWTEVDPGLLERTLNAWLLQEGLAYYTVYTSTPASHREQLRALALTARDKPLEVWARDTTREFTVDVQASIGPDGQLILPKLFRRCTDYLKAVGKGFVGNLTDWMVQVSASGSRNENDLVVIGDSIEVHLADLLHQRNQRVALQTDLLDLTFVEK
jgi:endonuclease YncB( thermonuclease family)